ncbi:YqaJ viral recombinase family protein ['Crotalaria aegyptiaca' phytoplasma]|uniref:YqaJ viral recombinase family protein n=1 Tax=Candidatus Phytoplasma crotalariae TaxID=2982627 RepID=A0ABT9D354_9MOLU|nr:YqaJ viral recombinase family protein ['Crotalaria aegyptiaca' phytoplasma]MDO8059438.1 YqaJ viral recombinase family protein ['Crotalaria aegyptiaca' phytoplasma]
MIQILEEKPKETKNKEKASSSKKPDYRQKYINASEVASITGLDPFRSMEQLVHDKLFGAPFTVNQYTLHGQKMEPIAHQFFSNKTKLNFKKTTFFDDQVNLFSASLDGYNEQNKVVLEIKCPFVNEDKTVSTTWTDFLSKPQSENIPRYYWAQVQCQLFCSKAKFAYFLVYFNDNNYHVVKIYQDDKFISEMIQASQKYLEFLNKSKEELEKTTYLKQLIKTKY